MNKLIFEKGSVSVSVFSEELLSNRNTISEELFFQFIDFSDGSKIEIQRGQTAQEDELLHLGGWSERAAKCAP